MADNENTLYINTPNSGSNDPSSDGTSDSGINKVERSENVSSSVDSGNPTVQSGIERLQTEYMGKAPAKTTENTVKPQTEAVSRPATAQQSISPQSHTEYVGGASAPQNTSRLVTNTEQTSKTESVSKGNVQHQEITANESVAEKKSDSTEKVYDRSVVIDYKHQITEASDKEPHEENSSVNSMSDEGISYYLPTNTMLQKRYRINSVIGEGGFGITYSGWDITLNIPIAIKEYYPSGLVTRNATLGKTTQVVPISQAKYGNQFRDGIDRVLDEARRTAKFRNTPGIVGIYDYFEANSTAYIVMEYVDGVTLDVYCKNNRVDNTTLFNLLVPVMDALQALHKEGIIHRDISPDNIMVDKDGNFKLLDFGAARGYSEESSTTMSIILKKSYAPEEQFRTKGNQGPWTDVYALGASIYEIIAGQTPPSSIDRLAEDEIVDIRTIAPSLTKGQATAIMKALEVRAKDRWQSIDEFKLALLSQKGTVVQAPSPKEAIKKKDISQILSRVVELVNNNKKKAGIIGGTILGTILVVCIVTGLINKKNPAYLGVDAADVPSAISSNFGVSEGAYIEKVYSDTPASNSGLVAGDILISMDKNEINTYDVFSDLIAKYHAGDRVKFRYLHLEGDEYIEKTQKIKLDNKNDHLTLSVTVDTVTTTSSSNSDPAESEYVDLIIEFAGLEPHSETSQYADIFLKISNPNSDTVGIYSSGIFLNDVMLDTVSFDGIVGNATTVVSKQVDYKYTTRDLIGDEVTSMRIEYNISSEKVKRSYTHTGFTYYIDQGIFADESNSNDTEDSNIFTEIGKIKLDEMNEVDASKTDTKEVDKNEVEDSDGNVLNKLITFGDITYKVSDQWRSSERKDESLKMITNDYLLDEPHSNRMISITVYNPGDVNTVEDSDEYLIKLGEGLVSNAEEVYEKEFIEINNHKMYMVYYNHKNIQMKSYSWMYKNAVYYFTIAERDAISQGSERIALDVLNTIKMDEISLAMVKSFTGSEIAIDDQFDVLSDYTYYYGGLDKIEHIIVIKNNSNKKVKVVSESVIYSADGKIIGKCDSNSGSGIEVIAPGETSAIHEYSSEFTEKVGYYSTTISVKDTKYNPIYSDIKYEITRTKNGCLIAATNNGLETGDPIIACVLLFKDGELVDFDRVYFKDVNDELPPGGTVIEEVTSRYDFDTINLYTYGHGKT